MGGNAQLWIGPDAWRFAPPDAPERPAWARGYQEPAWLQAQKDRATLAELKAAEAQAEADRRALQRELASMRRALELLKREQKARKAQFHRDIAALLEANERGYQRVAAFLRGKANFNPDQPRDDHGRWTDAGGGQGTGDDGGGGAAAGAGMAERTRIVGTVIPICVVEGKALFSDRTHTVTYRCADGRTIRRIGPGHSFPGIILQPR